MSGSGEARTLGVLGALYLAQGVVYGFGGFILIPSLAAAGVALEAQAGILALAGVPWVLKLAWAPLLDRFAGRRRGRARWCAAGAMLAMAVALAGLAALPSLSAEPSTVAWLWLAVNTGLSLQDVATDALVIDRVPARLRGRTNGVLLGGHHLGAEGLAGLGLGALVATRGLSTALWVQAAVMLAGTAAPLLLPRAPGRDEPSAPPRARPDRSVRSTVVTLLRRRRALVVLVVTALAMSADVLTGAISGQFWVQRLGWSVEALSTRLAPLLLVVNLLAYGLATAIADRLGHGRSAAMGAGALGVLWVGFGAVPDLWSSDPFVLSFVGIQAFATAAFYVGLHAALMGSTLPALRATHFAILMSLLNLPRAIVAPYAPAALDALGYAGLFMAAGGVQVAIGLVIGRVWPDGPRRAVMRSRPR